MCDEKSLRVVDAYPVQPYFDMRCYYGRAEARLL